MNYLAYFIMFLEFVLIVLLIVDHLKQKKEFKRELEHLDNEIGEWKYNGK